MSAIYKQFSSAGKLNAAVSLMITILTFVYATLALMVIAALYVLLLFIYRALPWSSPSAYSDKGLPDNILRTIHKTGHYFVRITIFLSLLICATIGLAIKYFPECTDRALGDSFTQIQAGNTQVVAYGYLASSNNAIHNSGIGIVRGKSVELLPSEVIVKSFLDSLSHTWVVVAPGGLLLAAMIIFFMLGSERNAEISRKLGNTPTSQ